MSIKFQIRPHARQLRQYYKLREECFRRELGLPDFDGSEEALDREGDILLALRGEECIGGARISRRVSLHSQLDLLGLDADTCCMWERFAIDPRVRSVQLIRDFCSSLIAASREAGYRHAMVLSSLRNARFYRRCHSALGMEFHIQRPVPHCAEGSFAGLEHYLSVACLQESDTLRVAV